MTIRQIMAGYPQLEGWGLKMFTKEELDQIHWATLEVLSTTGVLVLQEEAQEIFAAHGAKVDKETNMVKIPPYLVEEAIISAPSRVILYGRNPKYDVELSGNRTGFTPFGAGVMVVDPFTGEYRESTKDDVAKTALVADYLDTVDFYSQAVAARDVPEATTDLHSAEAFLTNTSKHCHHIDCISKDHVRLFAEMGAAIVGGMDKLRERPIISCLICPVSPLQLSTPACEVIIECARLGLPCNVLSMCMSGASAPVSLAGTLVTHNCEVLAGITLSQLTAKGAPVIYGSSTTTFDLTTATAPVGAPELGMISAGVAALAQYYRLPSYVAGT